MKFRYKQVKLFSFVLGAFFVAYLCFITIRGAIAWTHRLNTRTATVPSLPQDYADLFKSGDPGAIKNQFTELSSVRNPVSYFSYGRKYCVIVTKINIEKNIPITELINESINSIKVEEEGGYLGVEEFKFNFDYWTERLKASKIHLNLNGDSVKIIAKNDTLAYYYLKMESFSIGYKKTGVNDLVAKAKSDYVPASLLFLERRKTIYFVLMSVYYDDSLKPDSLYKLVIGRH